MGIDFNKPNVIVAQEEPLIITLLRANQHTFGLMRVCVSCRHTSKGVYPCDAHAPMIKALNENWPHRI
jgi:hypothetical protein